MLMNSKKMFWQALICGSFISTGVFLISSKAYAEANHEEKVAEVNQHLLTPNEAVDEMTDMNRIRRYYQPRASRSNVQTENAAETLTDTTEDEIKLPARIN